MGSGGSEEQGLARIVFDGAGQIALASSTSTRSPAVYASTQTEQRLPLRQPLTARLLEIWLR